MTSPPVFIHSGDAGDVIYAIPAMAEYARRTTGSNSFHLILGTKTGVRKKFTPEWAANLASLLKIQPCILSVKLQQPDDKWNVDVDPFRNLLFKRHVRGKTITNYVCDLLRVDPCCSSSAWLTVDEPWHVDGCPVVINRTGRYHNPKFPWGKVLSAYRDKAVFVGFQQEWEAFEFAYGPIRFCPTSNALELARMVAGCRLFVGNQSLAYSIAEGLKQNTLQETSPQFPDCIWRRPNAFFSYDRHVTIPDLAGLL